MNKLIPIVAALTLTGGAAFAQNAQPPAANSGQASQATMEFVQKAEAGSHFEIQTGHLAAKQASSKKVKQFGEMMVKDHGKAAKQLKAAIQKDKQSGLPTDTPMTSAQTNDYDQLKGLHGSAFDKEYVQIMVKDHQEDVQDFQNYASSGDDPRIKAFASKTSKVIERHLKRAQELQNSMQKSAQR